MMTISFVERYLQNDIYEHFKKKNDCVIYDIENMQYTQNALEYARINPIDSVEFYNAIHEAFIEKSEGFFFEIFSIMLSAYNGSDVIIVFDKNINGDLDIIECLQHLFRNIFNATTNIIIDDYNTDLKEITFSGSFDPVILNSFIEKYIHLESKINNGYTLNGVYINKNYLGVFELC